MCRVDSFRAGNVAKRLDRVAHNKFICASIRVSSEFLAKFYFFLKFNFDIDWVQVNDHMAAGFAGKHLQMVGH